MIKLDPANTASCGGEINRELAEIQRLPELTAQWEQAAHKLVEMEA